MPSGWIWVDLENTPHVLFLEPLIRRLAAAGWAIRISAKPQSHTVELAAGRGLAVDTVGSGDFSGLLGKVSGNLTRAAQLAVWAGRRGRPQILLSCSRSASLAAWGLRVPGVALLDYEHAEQRALGLASRVVWLPDVLSGVALPRATRRVARFYEGLKENLYLDGWALDRRTERNRLGVTEDQFLVVARPPADTAHYAEQSSHRFWSDAIRALLSRPTVHVLVVSRTTTQRARLTAEFADARRIRFLSEVVTGPALVAAADLVVGGGGTMNREAAVLGVPVWSVFSGPSPHIDECLAAEGRLRWVRNQHELDAALDAPVSGPGPRRGPFPRGLESMMADLEERLTAKPGVAA